VLGLYGRWHCPATARAAKRRKRLTRRTRTLPRSKRPRFDAYARAMKTLTALLVALSILVGFAPVARADNSADYLAQLDKMQIPYSDPADAINIGNTACQQLRSNVDPGTAIAAIADEGYTGAEAGQIAGAAASAFCPDMVPVLHKWADNP